VRGKLVLLGPLALVTLLIVTLLAGLASGCRQGPDKLVMGFVAPSSAASPGGLPIAQADILAEAIKEALGIRIEIFAFPTATELVKAIGTGQADIAVFNPFAYVSAHEASGAEVLFKAVTGGASETRSEIIVLAGGGPSTLAELRGKTFGFVDPASPSGYLFPAAYLVENGVVPSKDLAKAVFLGDQVAAVRAVIEKTVQAAACAEGTRNLARIQIPDLDNLVTVIATTPPVPGTTIAVRAGLDHALADRITQALLTAINGGDGRLAWRAITGADGIIEAQDPDYDFIRRAVELLGLDVEVLAG